MKTAEEMARQIRYRQRELATLAPDRRHALLMAEVKHACDGVGSSERKRFLQELEGFFPMGLPEGSPAAPAAPVQTPRLELDDLLRMLKEELGGGSDAEQPALRAHLAQTLGLEVPRPAAPDVPGALSAVFQVFKESFLISPDPVMNTIEPFSARDITDLPRLATKLRQQADSVSKFLWSKLTSPTQNLVSQIAVNPGRSSSDLNRCAEALASEFSELLARTSLYDEQRFAGVKLSEESRRLLGKDLNDRTLVRCNQALLEDIYPAEIRCQTVEREIIDAVISRLVGKEAPVTTESALQLAAVSLIELGCLEQFARVVLKNLNKHVFDPVNGKLRLTDHNELGFVLSSFLAEKDSGRLAGSVRYLTGLLKCLLFWYQFMSNLSAEALAQLQPEDFEQNAKGKFGGTDYEKAFNDFKRAYYNEVRPKLCGNRVGTAKLSEDDLKDLVKKTIEKKVTTLLLGRYVK
jgi:hypothetical protein